MQNPRCWLSLLQGWVICALLLPGISTAEVLDQQAQAWVQRQITVKTAPDPDLAPVDFFDSRGRHSGLSAELLSLISKRSGLRFETLKADNLEAAREQLSSGKVDLLSGVFQTERRSKEMLFSRPYLHLPAALIGRAQAEPIDDLAALKELRVAVVQGHVWQEMLQDGGFSNALLPFVSLREALLAVAEGRADVFVGDLYTADYVMARAGLKDALQVVGQTGLEADLAFAIRPDLPDLKRVIDQALASVSVAEESALRARWENPDTTTPEPAAVVPDSITPELGTLRTAVQAEPEWDDALRSAALTELDVAEARNAEADASLNQRSVILSAAEEARNDIEKLQAPDEQQSQAEEILRWRGSLPQRASVEELEQLLATEQAARTSVQDAWTQAANASNELQQRPTTLRRELNELTNQLHVFSIAEGNSSLRSRIQRLGRQADLRALRARQSLLQTEQNQMDLRLQGLEARKQTLARTLAGRNERINVLELLIAERSNNEMSAEIEHLRHQAQRYAKSPTPLRDLARENLKSAESLLALTKRLGQLRDDVQAVTVQTSQTHLALGNAAARLEVGGITDSIGMLLMAERRKLPNLSSLRAKQNAMRGEAADAQLTQIALSEEREQLGNLQNAMKLRLATIADSEPPLAPERRAQLSDLLLIRGQLLPRLQQQYLRVQELLGDADAQLDKLISDTGTLATLLEQNLLWVPSHPPVNWQLPEQVREQWRDLVKYSRWQIVINRIGQQLPGKPLWIMGLLLPLLLLLMRPRMDRTMGKLATALRNVREDRFRYTVQALLLSILRAMPMMLLSLILGHILQGVGDAGRFTHSLGQALIGIAPHIFFFTFIIAICHQQGLAHAHLRWPRSRRAAVLRLRPYLYGGVLPLLWLISVCFARDLDSVNGTLLRPVLTVLHLTLAGFSWWLLHPERLMSARGGGEGRHPSMRRWLRIILTLAFLMMAALPLFGFVLTSGILLQVSLNTLEVLLAVSLTYGLTLRWLMLGERRLALAQQLQSSESEQSERTDGSGANLDAPEIIQESVDVRLVSTQSRSLLRALTVLLLGLGLTWALADVAPAFAMLDRVVLWHTSSGADGATQMRAVTLGSVTLAMITLLLGISAARNVPGLLEILLLERFTGDASVRYAIVALTRYFITFTMLVAVFGFLGLRWGHLQWLAAAFSVGLGFGLQEIFGNFVAGIILLFERPFRVGDVVTIDELSGTVRRIRTRATTIVDFDNKEIVIPNKTFITERFVNWTLTDTTTRITIKVGVSYESDPRQVREQLLALAQAHPAVLREPAPAAVFMAISASTLDFELRCFVREIGDRLRAMDDLHTAIISRFGAMGIEIAFPQLDLHVRQLPAQAAASS